MARDSARPGGGGEPRLDPADICTLPPADFDARRAWIRREILPHAVGSERLEDGLAVELVEAPGLARVLDRWIELERACCGGITFERQASATPGRVRLQIRGVDPDASLFRALGVSAPRREG